jgi:hypothetical protein
MPIIIIMEGTRPLTGRALPNLINAVKMLKSKSTCLSRRSQNRIDFDVDFDFDFKHTDRIYKVG